MLFEIKREVCHFSLSSEIIPCSRLVADDSDCVMIHADDHYDPDCVMIHADDHYDPTHESQIATSPTLHCIKSVFISHFHL